MNMKYLVASEIELKDANLDQIGKMASKSLKANGIAHSSISVVDVSGNSGSKTYLCSDEKVPKWPKSHRYSLMAVLQWRE